MSKIGTVVVLAAVAFAYRCYVMRVGTHDHHAQQPLAVQHSQHYMHYYMSACMLEVHTCMYIDYGKNLKLERCFI